jgi:hypothetical protein
MDSICQGIRNAANAFVEARSGGNDLARQAIRELTLSLQGTIDSAGLSNIKAHGGYGIGTIADVPWVACTHRRFGFSASRGYFLVYLFAKGGKRVYLTLGVGAGTATAQPRRGQTIEVTKAASAIRSRCNQLKEFGFTLGNDLDLGSEGPRPRIYKAATAIFKEYQVDDMPPPADVSVDFLAAVKHFAFLVGEETELSERCVLAETTPSILACLSAKPFAILTGNSGTGKTKVAEQVADVLSNAQSSNWALVSVGADWTDSRSVIGFVNHLRNAVKAPWDGRPVYQSTPVLDLLLEADRDPEWPYFLILDEMNLSHVERYFADFLSAMEAKDGVIRLHSEGADEDYRLPRSDDDDVGVPRSLTYPSNLFVIGTVNVDETTYMFSPKVLDRAQVMEFQVKDTDIEAFLNNPKEYATSPAASEGESQAFLKLSLRSRGLDKPDLDPLPAAVGMAVTGHLMALFRLLQKGRFEFAYRTANEVNRYLRVSREMHQDKALWDTGGAVSDADREAGKSTWRSDLDDEILQKLLPRLHGSRSRLGPLLGALGCYTHDGNFEDAQKFFPAEGEEIPAKSLQDLLSLKVEDALFPRSFLKIRTMARVLIEEQFVSFIC